MIEEKGEEEEEEARITNSCGETRFPNSAVIGQGNSYTFGNILCLGNVLLALSFSSHLRTALIFSLPSPVFICCGVCFRGGVCSIVCCTTVLRGLRLMKPGGWKVYHIVVHRNRPTPQSGGLVCPKCVVEGWHYKSLLAWRSALFSVVLQGVVLPLLDNSIKA